MFLQSWCFCKEKRTEWRVIPATFFQFFGVSFNEFITCLSRILNLQNKFHEIWCFIFRGLQSVFFCYDKQLYCHFYLNRKLLPFRKAKLWSCLWHQTTKPRILFSPICFTNFSLFEQLKKKTNFSLVQNWEKNIFGTNKMFVFFFNC